MRRKKKEADTHGDADRGGITKEKEPKQHKPRGGRHSVETRFTGTKHYEITLCVPKQQKTAGKARSTGGKLRGIRPGWGPQGRKKKMKDLRKKDYTKANVGEGGYSSRRCQRLTTWKGGGEAKTNVWKIVMP